MFYTKPTPLFSFMAFTFIMTDAFSAEAELATTLEDVTVTATRVSKSVEKIPASVGRVQNFNFQ